MAAVVRLAVLATVAGVWLSLPSSAFAGPNAWTTSGTFGGNVYSVAVSPAYATDHTLFAGGTWFGASDIFKSTSGGTSWTQVITGLPPEAHVNALAVSPAYATDHTVFAGTDLGVYRSTSGGASWTAVEAGPKVYSVAVSPAYASDHTLFAGGTWFGPSCTLKSTSGGASWTTVNTGLPAKDAHVSSLAISPDYATDHTVFAATNLGVYESTSGGASWTAIDAGLTDLAVNSVVVSPAYATDHTLFAGGNGAYSYTILIRGTMRLNGGAVATNKATVTADSAVSGASQMRFASYDGTTLIYTAWQPYAAKATVAIYPPDGTKRVYADYRDPAGNMLTLSDAIVRDTTGPTTSAKAAKGQEGKAIALKYLVRDKLSPRATAVTLTVRNAHGKVVKIFRPGTKKVATWYVVKWTPKAKGVFRYTVTARDLAGNRQTKAGSAKITVG
ncbi:MAG: hypothetical protein ABR941_02215 [Thermoleophilia bacterium]